MGADDDDKTIVEKVMGNKMVMIGVIAMAEVFGIIGLALLIHFSREYYGGYEWGDMKDGLLFTYHPLFMYLGMIFFFGNAIMSFRVMNMLPVSDLLIPMKNLKIYKSKSNLYYHFEAYSPSSPKTFF